MLILCLTDLFKQTTPSILLEEKEKMHAAELSGSSNRSGKSEKLPFNQEACFTKCIVQLLLIGTVSEIADNFYDTLPLKVTLIFTSHNTLEH